MKDEVIQEILKEGRIYEVGGCVRDRLLCHQVDSKDYDYLVCGIPLEQLHKILNRHGFTDLVGKSFGVLKFTPYPENDIVSPTFDIALPRTEQSTGPAHTDFEVAFDCSLSVEQDLIRRDFSINAMACDLSNQAIIDPYGGQRDLAGRLIRMVSERSFVEDPLRMLRAIQFAARFEFSLEPKTYQSMVENASLVSTVSPERIGEELNKMLTRSARPSIGLRLMQESGLMKYIIPEMEAAVGCEQPGGFHAYDVFEHTLRMIDACPPRLRLRLAAIFHDITKPQHKYPSETGATFYGHEVSGAHTAEEVLKRLRYSNEIIKDVSVLVERHMFTTDVGPKGLRRFIRRVGQPLIPDLLDLRRADVIAQGKGGTTEDVDEMGKAINDEINRQSPFGRSDLAVDGDLLRSTFNLEPSPLVGDILEYLLEKVLDNPEDNRADVLLGYARDYLKENISSDKDEN